MLCRWLQKTLATDEMQLRDVVETHTSIAATRSRLKKSAALAALLRTATADELSILVPWLAGELRQGKIGVGYAAVAAAMQLPSSEASSWTVAEVDALLTAIGACAGGGSVKARKDLLATLFTRATADEQRFLGPLIGGELRQGALDGVMAEAVAEAAAVAAGSVRRAAMVSGNLVLAALAALVRGEEGLAELQLQVLRPVQPMLAQTAEDVAEALALLGGTARLETKLDGMRVQVHRRGDEVRIWSRALLPVQVDEVRELVARLPVREVVLDGEVLALDADGRPHPFQVSMSRLGRKTEGIELPVTPFFFDVLHVDGRTLLDAPLAERAAILAALLPPEHQVPAIVTADPEEGAAFLRTVLAQGHEGLMAKGLGTLYEAGSRGAGWLKIKPTWTLDLVVLAAEWGSGRRRGTLSNLHLGARDPERGGFVMLGKTFKGLTDELLAWQTRELLAREVQRDAHTVYARPELVVEIAFNEVQGSSRYPGGVALRFARVKGYRPDKRPEDADTIGTVRAIFAGLGDPGRRSHR